MKKAECRTAVPRCASSSTYAAMLVPRAEIEAADRRGVSGALCDPSLLLAIQPSLVAPTEGPDPPSATELTLHVWSAAGKHGTEYIVSVKEY